MVLYGFDVANLVMFLSEAMAHWISWFTVSEPADFQDR